MPAGEVSKVRDTRTISSIKMRSREYKTFTDESTQSCNGENISFHAHENKAEDRVEGFGDTTVKSGKTFTMQEALDGIGFGPYQILISFFFGFTFMADSMEVMLLTVLSPVLKCVYSLSAFEEALLTIAVFAGMLVSANPLGKIGDRYGRKSSLLLCTLTCSYFGVLTALSPSFIWILITRFLVAIGLGGFPQIFTYYSEFLPTESRCNCIIFTAMIWAVGACFEVCLAMLTLPQFWWRLFLVLTACPVILVTCLLWFLPESPRFLLAQGRVDEAYAILQRVAKMNGKRMPEGTLYHQTQKKPDSNRLADLFLPMYRKTSIVLGIIVGILNCGYFGSSLLTTKLFDMQDGCHGYTDTTKVAYTSACSSSCTSLTKSDYVDLLWASLGDSPGVLICIFLMSRFGRKTTLALQTAGFSISMLAINFCSPRIALVGLSFCARAMTNGAGQGLYVYITEVYPTPIRALGMGWCCSVRAVGIIIAALLAQVLLEYSPFLAISSFAASGFVATVLICLLPYETRNRKIADSLEEDNA